MLAHSPFRPEDAESAQDLEFIPEALGAIANEFCSLASHHAVGVPVQNVVQCSHPVK